MTAGRTTWSARDAAHHDRELVVEMLEEFGPAGPYVDVVLRDLAQQQRDSGTVKTGFRSLGRKTGLEPSKAREIVEHAAKIGLFDDLEVDKDGRRFTCRISGWDSDQARGKSAWKKADQRARDNQGQPGTDGDMSTSEGDMSPSGSPTIEENRSTPQPPKGALRFGRQIVPQARVAVAELILADFNRRAHTSYRPLTADGKPTEPFKRILGAIVAHPDLTAEEGQRINAAALADPFWDGPAQPGNVWGPGVIDRNRQKATTNGSGYDDLKARLLR